MEKKPRHHHPPTQISNSRDPIMHKSSAPTVAHLNRTTRVDESSANGEYDGGGPTVEELGRPRRQEA
ncbi:hypothetical protein RHMOL_Rhmol05G0166100 [Rhododendron molle]|uniref:Uncharacterized protein n=1 Tax=Rhododendron molle TaxID=49168 RepID=A0ACC0NPZ8_RHOML|nr:hypothetical protein RHMOL_Rhmol05G0166100 [Rhododendron molle]